jgi:arylsulfatase A
MKANIRSSVIGILACLASVTVSHAVTAARPNIVIVLADDLGYGDVRCYDPEHSKIPTPNLDRLAAEGMRFTAAHSPSAVCSPTRYGLLTGRYPWRSRLQRGVLMPYDLPLIAPDRLTLPALLKQHGYQTACIGKWHLGWQWPKENGQVVFDRPIPEGPTARGFDYYFGTDVPNFPPYTFIENDRVTVQPTEQFTGNREAHLSYRGPMAAGWRFDQILPTLADTATNYIAQRAKDSRPFFFCFPLTTPHEPITPSERFKGKSGINGVADLIMETDWALGQVMAALEQHGLAKNTLLISTADNGHSSYTGLEAFQRAGHRVSGPYRGFKSTVWEGGHREPFIARWPGVVKPGSHCDELICLTDLMATCAEIVGAKLPPNAGEDSVSILTLLKGRNKPVRKAVVTASVQGRPAIQQGDWKLILAPGSGGYGAQPSDEQARQESLPPIQLYHLGKEPGELQNLQAEQPGKVKELTALLEKYTKDGRSTAGPKQTNDVEVDWKKPAIPAKGAGGKEQTKSQG